MKNYQNISKKYEKKNQYIDNTLGYYKKPIFITLISLFLVSILTLLFIQVSNMETTERKPLIVVVDNEIDRSDIYNYLLDKDINFEYYYNQRYYNDYDVISKLQMYGVEKMFASNNVIRFYTTIIYINSDGSIKLRTSSNASGQINITVAKIKENVENFGWS